MMTARPTDTAPCPGRPPLSESLREAARQMSATGWLTLAAGFAAAVWATARSGTPTVIATYAVALTAMLLAAAIDSVKQRLPNVLTIGGAIVALAGLAATELLGDESGWWRAIFGGAIFTCWILATTLIVPGSYGLGDVKLAALCGILLTWHSWPTLAGGMIATQIAIAAILLAARRRRKMRVPLGPSFAAGTLIALAVTVL